MPNNCSNQVLLLVGGAIMQWALDSKCMMSLPPVLPTAAAAAAAAGFLLRTAAAASLAVSGNSLDSPRSGNPPLPAQRHHQSPSDAAADDAAGRCSSSSR
jgi:hypothetical protein